MTPSRNTRIVATIGPATDSSEMLAKLIDAGVNVFRLNMSHAQHVWVRRVIKDIRAAAAKRQVPSTILMDMQGPAIRTGDVSKEIQLRKGDKFTFTVGQTESKAPLSTSVNYDHFVNDVSINDTVLVDNGVLHMKVVGKTEFSVECEVLTPGKLGSRRHINLPGIKVNLPALTPKDLDDLKVGMEAGIDYASLSFVRQADDLRELRKHLTGYSHSPGVIAKIEDQQAIKNLEEIIIEADGIMVARGDLGIECPYEELPIIQRRIVKECLRRGRPVIVATHMLESMIENPNPTRAEVTDIANAVYEQADGIMLSGETTVGAYPLKCVEVFDRIAKRIERSGGANFHEEATLTSPRQKLIKSGVTLANQLRAEALIVFTIRGYAAQHAAWMRPRHSSIIAVCESWEVADKISLFWGVSPHVMDFNHNNPEQTAQNALSQLIKQGRLQKGQTVVVVGGISTGDQIVDAIQMRVID